MNDPLAFSFIPLALESYAHPDFPHLRVSLVGNSLDVVEMDARGLRDTRCFVAQFPPGQWMRVSSYEGMLLPVQALVYGNNLHVRWLNPDGTCRRIDSSAMKPIVSQSSMTGGAGPGSWQDVMKTVSNVGAGIIDTINTSFRTPKNRHDD
jgi:hypothetical protein